MQPDECVPWQFTSPWLGQTFSILKASNSSSLTAWWNLHSSTRTAELYPEEESKNELSQL